MQLHGRIYGGNNAVVSKCRWGPYYKQAGWFLKLIIALIQNGGHLKWLRGWEGKAMEYFDTIPVEVGKDGELLC